MSYLLFKSLHLISVISWMAGLLYLPRIFVYHVENFEKKETIKIFETMERKLYNYIMRPAMILSWLFGVILIYLNGLESLASLWLQIKLVLVFILTIYLGIKIVPQSKVYVIERFGKYHRTLNAGLSIIIPYLDTVAHRIDILERQLESQKISVITKDNVEQVTIVTTRAGFTRKSDNIKNKRPGKKELDFIQKAMRGVVEVK